MLGEGGAGGGHLPLAEAMEELGLRKVETHVYCRQNTVSQFIKKRTIMGMCLTENRSPG